MAKKQPVKGAKPVPVIPSPKITPPPKGGVKGGGAKLPAVPLTPKKGKALGGQSPLLWKGNFVALKQAVQDVDSSKNKADWVRAKIKIAIYEDETLESVRKANGKDDFLLAKPNTQDGDIPVEDRDDVAWQLYRAGERFSYTQEQLLAMYAFLPPEYQERILVREMRGDMTITSPYYYNQWASNVIRQFAEYHPLYMNHLYVQTAQQVNLQPLTNMSDQAMAVFLLSQTSQEVWNRELNIVPYVDQLEYVAANPIWQFFQGSAEQARGTPWRIAGTSFGASNVYVRQLVEALDFMRNLQSNPNEYSIDPTQINTDLVQIYPLDYTSLVGNEFQSVAALGYIMNWAGAREMIGVGSGDTDIPAISQENFGRQTTSVQEISAFSLGLVRYQDAVVAGFVARQSVSQTGDFWKLISVIEDMPNQSSVLGYSMGYDSSNDIVIGIDFIPYNEAEARAIVEAMRSVAINDPTTGLPQNELARQTLCRSELLQQSYRDYTDADPLAGIDCP